MKYFFIGLISSLLICSIFTYAYGEDVTVVKKGAIVPYDGVLFSMDKEQEVRSERNVLQKRVLLLSDLNEINNKEIEILSSRLKLYQEKTKELSELEVKREESSFFKNALYFISGAIVTGVISYGVIQANR